MIVTATPRGRHHRPPSSSLRMDGRLYRYLSLDMRIPELPGLTLAEREVVELVTEGLDNREIAERRGTSINTVGNQIAAVFDKLGVGSRFELAELVARPAGQGGPR